MKSVKQLMEERASIKEQMRDIVRNAENEGRSVLTKEEEARFGKFDDEFEGLTASIRTAEKIEKLNAEKIVSQPEKEVRTLSREEKDELYKRSWVKYLRHGGTNLNNEERDALNSYRMEVRGTSNQITTTDSLGGYLVPQAFSNELEKRMLYYGGMLEASRILRTENGEQIDWPTIDDTSNTANLTGEVASPSAIAVKDLTFSQKQLEAYTYDSGIIKVSVQLLQDSFFNLEDEIQGFFAERLGRKLNTDLTTGSGSSRPNGIQTALVAASEYTNLVANATISRADLLTVIHAVDRAYRVGPKVGFMFNDGTLKSIKALAVGSSDNRPLWQPSMREGEPDQIEGFQYWINNDCGDLSSTPTASYPVIFGNFDKYIVRIVRDMVVVPLRERYMDELRVGYISYMRADGECIQTQAFHMLREHAT